MDIDKTGWIVWILMGALAGWLATRAVRSRQGLPTNVIVGITGALTNVCLLRLIGQSSDGVFNIASVPISFIGAVRLLTIGRLWVGSTRAAY